MRINYIAIMLPLLLLCCGCSADEPEAVQKASATVTIMSPAARNSRAGETGPELINTWWMVFADESNTVRRILERPAGRTEAVQREEFTFSLDAGNYTIYAFANIDKSDIGVSFAVGQPMPALPELWNKAVGGIGTFVPMTGTLPITLTAGDSTGFEVEVVRLWAKMCFQFTTDASSTVYVSKISMTPALTGAVNLLPDYSSLGNAPELPDGTVCTTLDRTTNLTVTKDAGADETFYLFESTAANHPTGRYPISFELKYGDGTARTVSALAYNLAYINRNDFITIPVLITDWLVDIDVHFYPPIGGYPAVIPDKKGDEFYVTFGSSGFFEITARVSNGNTGTFLANDRFSVSLTLESGSELFSQTPALVNGEIVGELAEGKTGTAVINLDITVTEGALQHTFTRKLYIIKN